MGELGEGSQGGREGAASEGEVRGGRGGAWRHRGVEEEPGRPGGRRWKQEGARAASALATELLRCEGRKTTGRLAVAGWAASWSWARWAER